MKPTRIITTLFATLLSWVSMAQLVTSSSNPNSLVQNVLVGNGVSAFNVTYSGSTNAIGFFDGSNTTLPISSGLILTTGTIHDQMQGGNRVGPHGPNDNSGAGMDNGSGGWLPLTNQAGEQTLNAAVLEFDFIPQDDTVRFRYIFASEEYLEYVGSEFNDAFAFFIEGPGYAQPYNMARVPGTSTPITINNVNDGLNSAWYQNNGDGSNPPFNSSSQYLQYDGMTLVLEAWAVVECGETYHMYLAIADAGDAMFDSAIFLEANSFQASTPVETEVVLDVERHPEPLDASEGCNEVEITITRQGDISSALTVPITLGGTATEGDDYDNIPDEIIFNPWESTKTITFNILSDQLIEGMETILLSLSYPNACGEITSDDYEIRIIDTPPLEVDLPDVDLLCPDDSATLMPNVTGGAPPYQIYWSEGSSTSSITVGPPATQEYWVKIIDGCLGTAVTDTALVTVPVFSPMDLVVTEPIVHPCANYQHSLMADASGGSGQYNYTWYAEDDLVGFGPGQVFSPFVTTNYTVMANDQCGDTIAVQTSITITSPPLQVYALPDTVVCPGEVLWLEAFAQGGVPEYNYHWPLLALDDPAVEWTAMQTTALVVEVTDSCGTYMATDTVLVEVSQPKADFDVASNTLYPGLPIQFVNLSTGAITFDWDFDNGMFSTLRNPTTEFDHAGVYEIWLEVENEIGCTDSVMHLLQIRPEFYYYAPNAFTPNGDNMNDFFQVEVINAKSFELSVFNRWGERIFHSDSPKVGWDGTFGGEVVPDGVYVYHLKIQSVNDDQIDLMGHVTLLR